MALQFTDGRPFSCGSCPYEHSPVTEREKSPRILIQVRIQGQETVAMVDTGGLYLVCNPELADMLNLDAAPLMEKDVEMAIPRYGQVKGNLYLASLALLAEEGDGVELEVTAFVPRLWSDRDRPFAIMGLWRCLEKLRFAVDPNDDTFYFGTLANEG